MSNEYSPKTESLNFVQREASKERKELMPLTGCEAWFFSRNVPDPHYLNVSSFVEMQDPPNENLLIKAILAVITHHEALRLRFICNEIGWSQFVTREASVVPFISLDLASLTLLECEISIKHIATQLQKTLNLFEGPILRFALFKGCEPCRLLIIVHHQIIDAFSHAILLQDLKLAYQQLQQGITVQLPPTTTSLGVWTKRIAALSQTEEIKQDLSYWLGLPWQKTKRLPVDHPEGRMHNTVGSNRLVESSLSTEETSNLLHLLPRVYKVQIFDVLLMVLVKTFVQWTEANALQVSVVCHGRDAFTFCQDIDLTRTVGNFLHGTEHLVLTLDEKQTIREQIYSIKEQFKHMPHNGFSDDWLLYFCQDVEIVQKMQSLPEYEVVFNYQGQKITDSSHQPAVVFDIPTQSPENPRSGLLIYQAQIINKQLFVVWEYSEQVHYRSTVEKLAQNYMSILRNILFHCQQSLS